MATLSTDELSAATNVAHAGTIAFGHGSTKNAALGTFSPTVRNFLGERKNIRAIPTTFRHVTFGVLVTTGTLLPFEGLIRLVIVFGAFWHGQ